MWLSGREQAGLMRRVGRTRHIGRYARRPFDVADPGGVSRTMVWSEA